MRSLLSLLLLMTALALPAASDEDDFIPKDILHSVALGCSVGGYDHSTIPYSEAQVFVKWNKDSKGWDFEPIIARYTLEQGGVFKAIDDCREWLEKVKKKMQATVAEDKASKQP
jgi:hypothetical protein